MRRPARRIAARLLVVALALPYAGGARSAPVLERAPAPRFDAHTVAGEPIHLDSLLARGPVVLDFWATWCKPCIEAMPHLEQIHRDYGSRGATVLGISTDSPRNFSKVRPFAAQHGLTFPIVLDTDGRLQQLYQVRAMPTTIVIAGDGRIVRVRQGYTPGDEQLVISALDTLAAAPDTLR